MQDQATVFGIDLDIFSIGATHSGFPVSLRSRIALFRCEVLSVAEWLAVTRGNYKQDWMVCLRYKSNDECELVIERY